VGPFVLIAVWFFMLRQMQSGGNKALSFGKSRARLLSMQQKKVTFKDVAGVDEAKEELKEIIEYLREPQKFQKLGGRIPKGVLLVGPPGTGKTLLARAVAGEANVPFFSISGSDFVEMFVGVGASRVRDLFEQGKKNAPCIIFIDEIDAVGRHRGAGLGGGHDEREQTLNQLLVEMDGFESNDGVILVAATNRPGRARSCAAAARALRPARGGGPARHARAREILRVHVKKVPVSDDTNLNVLARGTPGFSGADLGQHGERGGAECGARESQAGHHVRLRAGQGQGADGRRAQVDAVERRGEARHRVSRGRPRAGFVHARPLRSGAQGHDHSPRHGAGRHGSSARRPAQLHARVSGDAAGHARTAGAWPRRFSSTRCRPVRATTLNGPPSWRGAMVCEYGMSRLGPLTFGKKEEQIFLGREIAQHRDFSEETARQIDLEVRRLIDEAYQSAHTILESNQDPMHRHRGGPAGARDHRCRRGEDAD
jgi:cell division protease FtsH